MLGIVRQAGVILALAAVVLIAPLLLGVGNGTLAQQASSSIKPAGGAVPGGAVGNVSDSELWRQLRYGAAGQINLPDRNAAVGIQSQGEDFRNFRNKILKQSGAWGLLAIVVLLAFFFLLRGRVRVDSGLSGRTVLRFKFLERFAHWLTAGSFVVLGLTGLNMLYGKTVLMPIIGQSAFAALTMAGKYAHNFLGFAFSLGVLLMIVLWIRDNLPSRHDIKWIAMGGGLFKKGVHPPATKFNAGQKLVFWVVVVSGLSLSVTGYSLMFPYQFALFAETFKMMNLVGFNLTTELTPLQETQLALLWHSVIALVAIVLIVAHIYIGTLGMEGAIDAVTTGEVDENWAREHHSLWLEEMAEHPTEPAAKPSSPAD